MADHHRLELVDDGPMGSKVFALKLDGFELKGVRSYTIDAIDPTIKELTVTLVVESINASEPPDRDDQ